MNYTTKVGVCQGGIVHFFANFAENPPWDGAEGDFSVFVGLFLGVLLLMGQEIHDLLLAVSQDEGAGADREQKNGGRTGVGKRIYTDGEKEKYEQEEAYEDDVEYDFLGFIGHGDLLDKDMVWSIVK